MFLTGPLQDQEGSRACPWCVCPPGLFCHILCAQNKLSPTPGSRPASSSKEAHLNQIIYSPNQKGNNVYNLQSSQVLAPAEAEELETNRSRVLCGGLCWPSGPLFREMNHESYVHMVQKPPSWWKKKMDKARGQAQIEAVYNVIEIKQGCKQKGSHLLGPGHSECRAQGLQKPKKDVKAGGTQLAALVRYLSLKFHVSLCLKALTRNHSIPDPHLSAFRQLLFIFEISAKVTLWTRGLLWSTHLKQIPLLFSLTAYRSFSS